MVSYIKDDYLPDSTSVCEPESYIPDGRVYRTEIGFPLQQEIPVLSGDDDIFSAITIDATRNEASRKAASFVAVFTRVFVQMKTPGRAYSKFIQNMNEQPDVVLDWVFKTYRVTFLFSNAKDDYYCVTMYDERSKQYESKSGPLMEEDYQTVAEMVLQSV